MSEAMADELPLLIVRVGGLLAAYFVAVYLLERWAVWHLTRLIRQSGADGLSDEAIEAIVRTCHGFGPQVAEESLRRARHGPRFH